MDLSLRKKETTENVYSVSKINEYVKSLFDQEGLFRDVSVRGEIGTLREWNYGIVFLNLKEGDSVIKCQLSAECVRSSKIKLKDGMTVTLVGTITTNPKQSQYTLKAYRVKDENETGEAEAQLLKLKQELLEQGLFDAQYKKPIPKMIKTLGVVSSEKGAVINDIINVTRNRNPFVQIVLYPSLVSGDGAVAGIVKGIKELEEYGADVIIVGRGGGSSEDLWVYNNREIAEAAFECGVPIVSAVGHEIDVTILDLVADLRASTPSQAAELAVSDLKVTLGQMQVLEDRLNSLMKSKIKLTRSVLSGNYNRLLSKNPRNLILKNKARADSLYEKLDSLMKGKIESRRHSLELRIEQFRGLSPLEKLNQGYAYVSIDGRTLNSVEMVNPNDEISVYLKDGVVTAEVKGKKNINY